MAGVSYLDFAGTDVAPLDINTPPNHRLPMTVKRQTISFDESTLKIIEDYRKKQSPICSFNDAVLALIVRASE